MSFKSLAWFLGIGIPLLVCVIWGWVKLQERYGIYYPVGLAESEFRALPDGFEPVTFSGEAGMLSGVWKTGSADSPVVVFFHGNAGHAVHRIHWLDAVVPEGWHGFVFDYRGYGRSEGTPSEKGLYRDGHSAVDYVRERVGHDRIVYHGRSMGVPVAAHAMKHRCPRGIIFESGFPSATSMAKTILPLPGISYLLGVDFNTVGYVDTLSGDCRSRSKLVVHGRDDRVVPFSLGEKLYDQLPEPKRSHFFDRVGHNDILRIDRENYTETVQQFYREATRGD